MITNVNSNVGLRGFAPQSNHLPNKQPFLRPCLLLTGVHKPYVRL